METSPFPVTCNMTPFSLSPKTNQPIKSTQLAQGPGAVTRQPCSTTEADQQGAARVILLCVTRLKKKEKKKFFYQTQISPRRAAPCTMHTTTRGGKKTHRRVKKFNKIPSATGNLSTAIPLYCARRSPGQGTEEKTYLKTYLIFAGILPGGSARAAVIKAIYSSQQDVYVNYFPLGRHFYQKRFKHLFKEPARAMDILYKITLRLPFCWEFNNLTTRLSCQQSANTVVLHILVF